MSELQNRDLNFEGASLKVNGTTVISSAGAIVGDIQATTGSIGTAELADDAVTIDKVSIASQSVTASADGTGTGAITTSTALRNFIAVTSAAGTNQVSLPGISADKLGQEFYLTVGANGFELITPASSNATINQVDADGSNQLDVAANTTVRVMCVSATGWIAETIAAATIAVTAPDND